MIRTFVGFGLPGDIVRTLEKAQGGLHAGDHVRPENFHVTLHFMDENTQLLVDRTIEELAKVKAGPMQLGIEGLGTAGGRTPEALYAEVEMTTGLKNLHRKVGHAIREAGVMLPHQKYTPHVTLARFGALGDHDLKQMMSFLSRRMSLSAGPFSVTEFHLYQSTPGPNGPVYDILETYSLNGA